MPQANIFSVLSALLAVLGAILVALLTYWLTRRKTAAEIAFIKAQTEKLQRELSVESISSAVSYRISGSTERIIYNSAGRDVGFDFQGSEAQLWQRIDGVDRPVSEFGTGRFSSEGEMLNIERTNTEGRFEVWLQAYFRDNKTFQVLLADNLAVGQRAIRISFEAKAVDASHTLRIVLKNEKANEWLGNESQTVSTNNWTPIKIYFQISPGQECRLRIDDMDVTRAPSSVQIRNLVVAERLTHLVEQGPAQPPRSDEKAST